MSLRRTILDAIKTGVAAAASLVSVVVLLAGSAQICLCDPDPDNCGENCHVCVVHPSDVHVGFTSVPATSHLLAECAALSRGRHTHPMATAADCRHVWVVFGDLFSSVTDVSVPFVASCPVEASDRMTPIPFPRTMRPASTAPPDTGGVYLLHATRIYPRA